MTKVPLYENKDEGNNCYNNCYNIYIYIYPFSVISSLICNHKIFLKGRYLYFVANILH